MEEEEGEREGRVELMAVVLLAAEVEGAKGFAFWKMARDWRKWGEVVVIVVDCVTSGCRCFIQIMNRPASMGRLVMVLW